MAVVMAEPKARPAPWPRVWVDQAALLERQHDRLEACLLELLQRHGPERPAWGAADALALEGACRRLLWDLRLHLRLEERWLRAQGCLCPGHRSAHRDALQAALSGFLHASGDRQGRYFWLQALQSWFLDHRQGADAHAYALAHHSS
jgi:hemerythrin